MSKSVKPITTIIQVLNQETREHLYFRTLADACREKKDKLRESVANYEKRKIFL